MRLIQARFRRLAFAPLTLSASLAVCSLGALGAQATAQPAEPDQVSTRMGENIALPPLDPRFAQFAPSGRSIAHRIDYSIWDAAMGALVYRMGPSLRQSAGAPEPGLGSRRMYGHSSRYRLEGNRVMFSFLDAKVIESFTEYREDLERTADLVDIPSLPRNEQLAYWINLHNVAVIEQIAKAWPIRQPREILVNGAPLDEARFITVKGVAMSPRDIRRNIVYRHWRDPKVIYGFWRGEIGGPSIQAEAFNGSNVARLLEKGARDFVNSLRGVQKSGATLEVSTLYLEARPFFFPRWPEDLRAHLAQYANDEVQEILAKTNAVEADIEEHDIADLAGGVREPSYTNITSNGASISFRVPQGMARLLFEQQRKIEKLIREGRTGTVIFNDIALPGEDPRAGEVQ